MRRVWDRTLNFLRTQAGWFIALAWLLLILAFVGYFLVGAAAGIAVFYHPLHQNTPFHLANLEVSKAAFFVAIIVALGSSIAMLLQRRLLAAISVILTCIAFPVGAKIRLSLAQPGPQEFPRYIGNDRFMIPWTFSPRGVEQSNTYGLVMQLCPENLRGTYDPECRNAIQLIVQRGQRGFERSSDMDFFQKQASSMQPIEARNNHRGYAYTSPPNNQGKTTTSRYYLLRDEKGQPIRIVKCYEFGICAHTALIDRYALEYSVKDAPLADWQAMDRKLMDFINSWRSN